MSTRTNLLPHRRRCLAHTDLGTCHVVRRGHGEAAPRHVSCSIPTSTAIASCSATRTICGPVARTGRYRSRLTTFPGKESMARFSPDGKWLAFTASYEGASDAYVMPAEGGEPKRLTYAPGGAQVLDWTPDGTRVVIRSSWRRLSTAIPTSISSRATDRRRASPIDRGVLCSFSPDGNRMLYCRKGREEYQWKRYKGGQYCDIWMYDFTTRAFVSMSRIGRRRAVSDVGGRTHVLRFRSGRRVQPVRAGSGHQGRHAVTRYHTLDVMMPDTDGSTIVYVQDGYIHVLNCADPVTRRSRSTCRPTAGRCGTA